MDYSDKIIIDYLTITFKVPNFHLQLMDYLHIPSNDSVVATRNRNFDQGIYFMGIRIMWNTESGLVLLECTGQGCRTVESLNPDFTWANFIYGLSEWLTTKNDDGHYIAHISRIDLAYDIFDNDSITVDRILKYITKRQYASLSARWHPSYRYDDFGATLIEKAVYIGSEKSDRFLRIYDKALEQGVTDHKWLRFEMQNRNDNATSVVLNLIKYNFDVGYVYKGILRDYLRFMTKSRDTVDPKHINRIPTCRWWLDLLGNVGKIKQLYLPGIAYNAGTLYRYITHQVSSSLLTFVSLSDGDISHLIEIIEDAKLNFKQKEIANLINTTQQQYSKIEKGISEITADKLIKLCLFYNVSADYILGLPKNMPYPER